MNEYENGIFVYVRKIMMSMCVCVCVYAWRRRMVLCCHWLAFLSKWANLVGMSSGTRTEHTVVSGMHRVLGAFIKIEKDVRTDYSC